MIQRIRRAPTKLSTSISVTVAVAIETLKLLEGNQSDIQIRHMVRRCRIRSGVARGIAAFQVFVAPQT